MKQPSNQNPGVSGSVLGLLDDITALRRSHERENKLRARDHAPEFSAAELVLPDENALSRVIAWMLDAEGNHGQGASFRNLFFERFLPASLWPEGAPDWTGALVGCEQFTLCGTGRIDILIQSRDRRHGIAIENKPWANWQDRQLARYRDDLKARQQVEIVLALIGHVSDAQAEVRAHWWGEDGDGDCPANVTGIAYPLVADWMQDCADRARPASIRAFLRDIADYCRRYATLEGLPMSGTTEISELILNGGPDRLAAAFEVEAALNAVRDRLAARLIPAVRKELPGWTVSDDIKHSSGWSGFAVAPAGEPEGLHFYVYGPPGYLAWMGILRQAPKCFTRDIGGYVVQGKWRWWRSLSEDDKLGGPPEKAWAIESKTLAMAIARIARACTKGAGLGKGRGRI